MNRMVALEVFRTTGARLDLADGGREALALLQTREYDAVLMDVQMPEMDGYETTRAIRKTLGLTELPILAMTAHAMRGVREKCLAAGMNDYVSKPISRRDLFAALRRRIPKLAAQSTADSPLAPEPETVDILSPFAALPDLPGLDAPRGLARTGLTWDQYVRILGAFCRDQADFSSQFLTLLAAGDLEGASRRAHSLKGAASNLAAADLAAAAEHLEQAGLDGDQVAIRASLPRVEELLAQVAASRNSIPGPDQPEPGQADQVPPTTLEMAELIARLKACLGDMDPVCSDAMARSLSRAWNALHPDRAEWVQPLLTSVGDYDFEKCQALLAILEQNL